MAAEEPNSVP